jgi:hypothetical protein
MSKKQWSDWDGNLKSVAALYNQMTPRARQRLHAYLEDVTNPSSLVKTKLTNPKELDDGIYTVELREMLNYMDAQLQDQAPYFDDRLLSRRRNVAQAVENLEESERTLNEIKTAAARRRNETNRENERGATWASI